ncbi:MAG: hypothetical protein LBG28_03890 [Tannerella sp.]|jgi:hypothetical protein|nr:hypothetical protein [Tannerella sp.]
MKKLKHIYLISLYLIVIQACTQRGATSFVPSFDELDRPFGKADVKAFQSPPLIYHPETWFHFIGGNVAAKGVTADLEAIAGAGLSGVQFFHGQFGGAWPGIEPQITCLSPAWEDALKHTAKECRRLGLKFTMQNCPGWAMSGGPWITPENAMRHLAWSRTDVEGGRSINVALPVPQPSEEDWRNYIDIVVLAFPTPQDDTGEPLKPLSVKSNDELTWKDFLSGKQGKAFSLPPAPENDPHWIEITFPEAVPVRTVEFSSINGFDHGWCYEPGVTVGVQAVLPDGTMREILYVEMPQSSWQDDRPISFACPDATGVTTYRITIANKHNMSLGSLRLFSAARKNNWESEAGWTLRSIVRTNDSPAQSPATFIQTAQIRNISSMMDGEGHLTWDAPAGKWTILRIGHVNTGQRNAPAPPEGTGWECNKLSASGPDAHFAGYIGRIDNGTLAGGLLNGMLMDSWECKTQTWTNEMEAEFERVAGYQLIKWLPAVFGYVLDDHETTTRFLHDWRATLGDLFANKFYGRMAKLAHDNDLAVTFETAAGDIFPADIMEYYKHADVPMCEFWHPIQESFVGSLNFKPIKPAASAARLYGKPRVAAEAFTSFNLTWDEHLSMLKEVANHNCIEGVTHLVFHTYTHNPHTDWLPPGTSFGSGIGTPFLRGQTWWKYMPEFTTYLSRLNYMFERGKPVSDVLWYLGDEINHKPDQNAPFPKGYKYDYCNPDVLLNRLSVADGKIVTPEGISYRVMWLPDNKRMLPETLEKLLALVNEGAVIVGNAPKSIATLSGSNVVNRELRIKNYESENLVSEGGTEQRFDAAVKKLWGDASGENIRTVGKGRVLSGMTIDAAVKALNIPPDVTGEDAMWLHRRTEGADWYYVCSPVGSNFKGELNFNNADNVEIWDPVSGEISPAEVIKRTSGRTTIRFDLEQAGSCFVVFGKSIKPARKQDKTAVPNKVETLSGTWTLVFPSGWGAPASFETAELKAWKDLDLSPEAKSFSGTATYTTTFNIEKREKDAAYSLDLGRVEMIAAVMLNGKKLRTLWTPPYRLDITDAVKSGTNTLQVEVTSTWFNRLVYDANQPEKQRKTWTINGPSKDAELKESGLLGPVELYESVQSF